MNEERFWKSAAILYKAWQTAEYEDMQNLWKWKTNLKSSIIYSQGVFPKATLITTTFCLRPYLGLFFIQ